MCARSCADAGVADDANDAKGSLASAASNTTLGTGFAKNTKQSKLRECLFIHETFP
jgi:hypothetical protein